MTREHLAYAFLTTFICGFGSGVIGYDLMLEREKAKQALIPKPVIVRAQPAMLINCDGGTYNAMKEVARVCRGRARSAEIR